MRGCRLNNDDEKKGLQREEKKRQAGNRLRRIASLSFFWQNIARHRRRGKRGEGKKGTPASAFLSILSTATRSAKKSGKGGGCFRQSPIPKFSARSEDKEKWWKKEKKGYKLGICPHSNRFFRKGGGGKEKGARGEKGVNQVQELL